MIDYRQTYRMLQRTLESIEQSADRATTLSGIVNAIVQGPGPDLGITGGRLYRHEPDKCAFVLEATVGGDRPLEPGLEVPDSYLPVRRLVEEGFVISEKGDPDFDEHIEGRIGVQRFAAISIGEDSAYLIAFSLAEEIELQQAIYLLGTIRHVVNLRLLAGQLLQDVNEARKIQLSMLPKRAPDFHGYDIAARSLPADAVGGDLYDFPLLSGETMGLAVADSSGHGLPAALMARDVVTGLRVALDVNYRAVRAIEKVNRVVSQSALVSRFISLFYAEIEASGNLMYCNAGHPPALLWREGQIRRLTDGGIVLGVDPKAHYQRRFDRMLPGSMLVVYTDGISEARGRRGNFFGSAGLEKLLRAHNRRSAAEFVDIVFHEIERRASGPREDDQTIVVVRRPE